MSDLADRISKIKEEIETLKEKIQKKKESLADDTRNYKLNSNKYRQRFTIFAEM